MYEDGVRRGEGVCSYPGGRQDVGVWRGHKLIRLKFAIRELDVNTRNQTELLTPDTHSRGKFGPKGNLEVCKNILM